MLLKPIGGAGGGGVSNPLTSNLDFAHFKAVAMACDSGSTLPASPVIGQWFLHTPTGRSILFQYDGSAWKPIISYGSMTVYVDTTNGTDAQDKGYGTTTNAFKTIQYAVDQIPGLINGNVVINAAAGTYAEAIIFQGKNFAGNYTITLNGVLTLIETITASSGVTGSGATQGSITRNSGTWTTNQRQNLLVKGTSGNNNGTYRIIDSNTATVATIVGVWDGAVVSGDTFEVYDWAVTISGTAGNQAMKVVNGQKGILIYDIVLGGTGSFAVYILNSAEASFYRCKADGKRLLIESFSTATFTYCAALNSDSYAIQVQVLSNAAFIASKAANWASSASGAYAAENSKIFLYNGSIVDGITTSSRNGLFALRGGIIVASYSSAIYTQVKNCSKGSYASGGGVVLITSAVNYTGNTTNESPSGAADWAYID